MNPALQKRIQRYGWDKAAHYYEGYWLQQIKSAQLKTVEMAEFHPGHTVVDVACGTGVVSRLAAERVQPHGFVSATDISGEMIELATALTLHENYTNIQFIRQGAEEYNFPANHFDRALCVLGLMYVVDPLVCLRAIFASLKAGGRTVCAVWGERKNCGWSGIFPIIDAKVKSEVCPLFFQLGTGNTLADTFRQAGYQNIVEVRIHEFLPYENSESAIGAAFVGGPVALAYSKFTPELKAICHTEYLESIDAFRSGAGYRLPGEFVIVSGEKC